MKKVLIVLLATALAFSSSFIGSVTVFATGEEKVIINEICSSNGGTNGNLTNACDEDGKYCDWIELYNASDAECDISGWGISDSISNPFKAVLPQGTTIGAKKFLLVYCCKTYTYNGSAPDTNISVPVNISSGGETILLTKPSDGSESGTAVSKVTVPALSKDSTYGALPDGENDYMYVLIPTPGKPNKSDESVLTAPSFSHETGFYKAVSSIDVSLSVTSPDAEIFYTTDSSNPADTGVKGGWDDTAVQSYGYIIELENTSAEAAKTAVASEILNYQSNANMSVYGEADYYSHAYVAFRALNMKFADAVVFAKTVETAMKATAPEVKAYLATVTDSDENNAVYAMSGMGFYLGAEYDPNEKAYKWANGEAFSFDAFNDEEGINPLEQYITYGTIVNRSKYTGAIKVTNRSSSANVLATDAPKTVDKATVLKAVAKDKNGAYSEVETKTYFIGSTFNAAAYSGSAIVSLSTDYNSLYSGTYGIHTNPTFKGREWERAGHMDYIDENGEFGTSANCGVRISGAASRGNRKKSFRLYARNDYGDKYFNYDFFSDSKEPDGETVDEYKSLTLRSGANAAETACYTDNYLQNMLKKIGGFDTQEGNVCLAFLDGEFWGVYILQENYDATYFNERYDVKTDDVLLIKNGLTTVIDPVTSKKTVYFGFEVEEGEDEDISIYDNMLNWFVANAGKFSDNALYEKACEQIDIDSFVNYMVAEMAIGNQDWSNNNASMWRTINNDTADKTNKYNDGKWRFNMFDTEFSTDEYNGGNKNDTTFHYSFTSYLRGIYYRSSIDKSGGWSTAGGFDLMYMLKQLLDNQQFNDKFIAKYQDVVNIVCDLAHTKSMLKPYQEKWDSIISGLQQTRWSSTGTGTRINWLNRFFTNRKPVTPQHIRSAPYALSSGKTSHIEIKTNDLNGGKVYLNDMKLYLEDYDSNTFTADYMTDYDITLHAKHKDGYKFVGWSGSVYSDDDTVTVSLEKAVNTTAIFVKDGENADEILDTPSVTGTFDAPDEPQTASYSGTPETKDGETLAVSVFDAQGKLKQAYYYSENGTYTKPFYAFSAAKDDLLSGETLRLECDIEVIEMQSGSTMWKSVFVTKNEKMIQTLDVNGYRIFCENAGVIGFSAEDDGVINIINSKQKGVPTADDKADIEFTGNGAVFTLASPTYGKSSTINLIGVKVKVTNSANDIVRFLSGQRNQLLCAYRTYFAGSAAATVRFMGQISEAPEFSLRMSDCVDENTVSLYCPSITNQNLTRVEYFGCTLGAINGASGNSHHLRVLLANSTLNKFGLNDGKNSVLTLYGKSKVLSCSPVFLYTPKGYGIYRTAEKENALESRAVLPASGAVYSFFSEPDAVLVGDCNNDLAVNASDVLILKKYLAKYSVVLSRKNSDMNSDGKITVADILLLKKMLAGL